MNERQYMIFNLSEINLINFAEVMQTSADTVRKSVDGTKTFVKWENIQQPIASVINEYELDIDGMPLAPNNPPVQVIEVQPPFIPACVASLTTKQGPYTQSEIKSILATADWTNFDLSNMDARS
jgi:hypothetical protein